MYFLISNLDVIIFFIWILVLFFVALRFFISKGVFLRKEYFSKINKCIENISFKKLIFVTIVINIFYGILVTWAQYYTWANSSIDYVKTLVNLPLSKETPFPYLLEWVRPLFEKDFGYFLYYVFGRFWFYILISFLISGILYYIFKIWKSNHGSFSENGPELLLILMLIVGWPGIFIFIPLGFLLSVILSIIYNIRGKKTTEIEPAFILAGIIVLIFGKILFTFL